MSEPRIYLKRGIWQVSLYDWTGKRRQLSTYCTDRKAALLKAKQLEREYAVAPDPSQGATLGGILNDFVKQREQEATRGKKSPETASFYRKKAGHLLRVFEYPLGIKGPQKPYLLTSLTPGKIDEYVTTRRGEGVSENTISKELVTLRASLKLARRNGLFKGMVESFLPVGFAPEYKPRSQTLTAEQLTALLSQLTEDRAARVAFIVGTSACLGETIRAQRDDVADESPFVTIRGTKRASRARTVPLVAPWQQQLVIYSLNHGHGTDGALFRPWLQITRDLAAACVRAKIPKVSANDLRRTCATWLREQGASLDLVSLVMGHTDTRMVERVYGRLGVEQLAARLAADLKLTSHPGGHTEVTTQGCLSVESDAFDAKEEEGTKRKNPTWSKAKRGFEGLPRDGVEPPARGFSVPWKKLPKPLPEPTISIHRKTIVTPKSQPAKLRPAAAS